MDGRRDIAISHKTNKINNIFDKINLIVKLPNC